MTVITGRGETVFVLMALDTVLPVIMTGIHCRRYTIRQSIIGRIIVVILGSTVTCLTDFIRLTWIRAACRTVITEICGAVASVEKNHLLANVTLDREDDTVDRVG